MKRTLTHTIPMGPKRAQTTTTHTVTPHGVGYVVRAESSTSGVPYGDDFSVSTTYCITTPTSGGGVDKCLLRVNSEVVFVKKVSALSRKIVTKGAHEGMKEFTGCLLRVLRSESDLLGAVDVPLSVFETDWGKEKPAQMKHPE